MKTNELVKASMDAAIDLTDFYDSDISNDAICARMRRVAEELLLAAEDYENECDRRWS